jgi:uncharacterized protein
MGGLILCLGAAFVGLQIWQDRSQYPAFKAMTATRERQRMYRHWVIDSFIKYGLFGLGGLYLLKRGRSLFAMPADFVSAVRDAATTHHIELEALRSLGTGFLVGTLIVALAAGLMPLIARKRGIAPPVIGDIAALIPRTRAEIYWGALLSVNAGVVEEIFFRLLLPFAWYAVTQDIVIAFLASALMFGLVHAYQGVVGILATTLVGLMLTLVYLATQQIWAAVLLHTFIDLRAMVLMPLASGAAR